MRALEEIAAEVLDLARKAGAEAADTLVARGEGVSMAVRAGQLEEAGRDEATELGLRVMIGARQATVSSSDIRSVTLGIMAERAVAMAREAPEDPYAGLAEPDQLARDWDLGALDLVDPNPSPAPAVLAEAALATEAAALTIDGVSQVSEASAGYGRTDLHLAATNGFSGGYARTSHSLGCSVIAGTGLGMEEEYAYEGRIHASDMPSAHSIGVKASERALAALGASKPPTGSFPVLFDERIAGSLMAHLVAAINGSSITRGASWLIDRLGQQILPSGMDLVEDPRRTRTARSRPFDAEGLPTQSRKIIDNGVLTGWTLDLATARQLGLHSTASASRGTGGTPSPSTGNLDLTQGARSRAELVRDMGEGLLVTGLIGATINPNTGDYSRGASGFWVRGGEIAQPVNECTIAGNLIDMLKTIQAGDDANPHLSRRVPSLLVEGLTIAGA